MIPLTATITSLIITFNLLIPLSDAQLLAAVANTPRTISCPINTTLVRLAGSGGNQALNPQELAYVSARRNNTLRTAWASYLAGVEAYASSQNLPLPSYMTYVLNDTTNDNLPTLGLAVSGGGYRAALFNAGVLNALDSRNPSSVKSGMGGLLQAATYITGSSSGSWLVGSLAQANFPTMTDLVLGSRSSDVSVSTNDTSEASGFGGWLTEHGFVDPTPSSSPSVQQQYIKAILTEIAGKFQAGFPVTFSDLWARVLARHFVNGTNEDNFFDFASGPNTTEGAHGAGELWSQLPNLSSFQAGLQPFPIVVTNVMSPNQNNSAVVNQSEIIVPLTNTVYEFNPFEIGSFDPTLSAFIPTALLGTTPASIENGTCVTGYDQTAFVLGLSSNLFNAFNDTPADLASSLIGPIIPILNSTFPQPDLELSVGYLPNPFQGIANDAFLDAQSEFLTVVDGGEDGEALPLQPLLVKARAVDVIFASDASSQTWDNFENGTAILNVATRVSLFPDVYSLPPVPASMEEFMSLGLNRRPTFFGCNSMEEYSASPNATANWVAASSPPPLVIYLPNTILPDQAPVTNSSTLQDSFTPSAAQAILDQTFEIATRGIPGSNSVSPSGSALSEDRDLLWPVCLACAVVDRARTRSNIARDAVCERCFSEYCYS